MKKNKKTAIIILLVVLASLNSICGQTTHVVSDAIETTISASFPNDTPNEISLSQTELLIDVTTNYIWRDYVYRYAAFQPSTTYSFRESGFSLNIWSSFELYHKTTELEISSTLSYDFAISKSINSSVGLIYYCASVPADFFGEVLVGFSFPTLIFEPSIDVYTTNTGVVYTSINLEKQLCEIKNSSIVLNSSFGHRVNDSSAYNGFRNLNLGISTSFSIGDFELSPFSSGTYLIDSSDIFYQAGLSVILK